MATAGGVAGGILAGYCATRRRQDIHSSASAAELAARISLFLLVFFQTILDIWNACSLPFANAGPIVSIKVPVRKKDPSNNQHYTSNILYYVHVLMGISMMFIVIFVCVNSRKRNQAFKNI